jgi:hypothetical protein
MTNDTKQAMFGSADDSAEFPVDVMPGLADLTMTSLAELAKLDESVVDETLDRLLPRRAALGSRQWNQDKTLGDSGPR